jgi:hypothetical protein
VFRVPTEEEVKRNTKHLHPFYQHWLLEVRKEMADEQKPGRALDNSDTRAKAHHQMDFADWMRKCHDVSVRALGKEPGDLMQFNWRDAYSALASPHDAVAEAAEADATDEDAADKVRALPDYKE